MAFHYFCFLTFTDCCNGRTKMLTQKLKGDIQNQKLLKLSLNEYRLHHMTNGERASEVVHRHLTWCCSSALLRPPPHSSLFSPVSPTLYCTVQHKILLSVTVPFPFSSIPLASPFFRSFQWAFKCAQVFAILKVENTFFPWPPSPFSYQPLFLLPPLCSQTYQRSRLYVVLLPHLPRAS